MSTQAEIFNASNAPGIYEVGGTHGQLGVDFQRYWAITRIIELVGTNQPDFLILFETIQDVMELDSATDPAAARIYQVKKKQTSEWTWKALTGLPPTTRRRRASTEMSVPKPFTDTPIGKLATALAELDLIQAEGFFVSNSGCDAELEGGSTAGTLDFCCFSLLAEGRRDEISAELTKLKKGISIDALHLHKTDLSLNDLHSHAVGKVYAFLESQAPSHTGQAGPFTQSLFATVSARGRKTGPASDFSELKKRRGYSKDEFMEAVETLRSLPDQQVILARWLTRLTTEGMNITDISRLEVKLTQIFARRLGIDQASPTALDNTVKQWVAQNPVGDSVLDFLKAGTSAIQTLRPGARRDEVHAALLIEGVTQCLVQI